MSAKTGLPSKAVGGLWALALQGSAYGIVIEKMEVLSRILVCAQCDKEHRPELMYLTWGVGPSKNFVYPVVCSIRLTSSIF